MSTENTQKIFISYSHKDRQWLEELFTHLAPFRDTFDVWADSRIDAGANWEDQIKKAIDDADAAIILVSANYLASDFLQEIEIPSILKARQLQGTIVLPILVSPCLWEATELSKFQFLNPPNKPLSNLTKAKRDAAYVEIADQLHSVLAKPEPRKPGPTASTDFADEIAKKVFDLIKADIQTASAGTYQEDNETVNHDSTLVFVICSFHEDMEPIYEGIKAAAHAVGLEAKRVKDVMGDYQITSQIMSMIANARLVVADLTHERPNVYFELGYARGIGKTVVTCARDNTQIHFDVKDWTYIPYNDSRVLEKALIDRFRFELEKGA
jgi:hypothetical protein